MKKAVRMKNPVHPGKVVRRGCLEALGLTVTVGAHDALGNATRISPRDPMVLEA